MELHLIKPIEWRSSSRCMSLPAPANLFHLCRINLSVCKWCGRLCRRQQTGPPASWLCSPLYAAPQQFLLHKLLYYGSFVTQFVCTNIILIQNILRSVLIFASKYFTYYFVYKLLLQNFFRQIFTNLCFKFRYVNLFLQGFCFKVCLNCSFIANQT